MENMKGSKDGWSVKKYLQYKGKDKKRKHALMGQYGMWRQHFCSLHTSIVGLHMCQYVCGCMCVRRTSADLKAMFYTFQHVLLSLH